MAGQKRKYGEDNPNQVYSNKARARPSVEARVDPTYGQRSAIPGLDDDTILPGDDDELNYDDEMDALAYLRAVRKEATSIPNLLVAPKSPPRSNDQNLYADEPQGNQGWYEDGAYLNATRPVVVPTNDAGEDTLEAQLSYFNSILTRYQSLREQLQQAPPEEALEKLGSDRPTYVPNLNRGISQAWIRRMQTMDPNPAQIASMNKSSIFKLIRLLNSGTMLKRNVRVHVGVSRWVWALLAKLPDRGELTSEEIGVVRDLGRKAVLLAMSMAEEQSWAEGLEEVENTLHEDSVNEEVVGVVNVDEIDLDVEYTLDEDDVSGLPAVDVSAVASVDSLSTDPHSKCSTSADKSEVCTTALPDSENQNGDDVEEGELAEDDISDALAAAKARILGALTAPEPTESINLEPEIEINVEPEIELPQEPAPAKFSPEWNTRTTVDMIITVAGEAYGQRDLLEFRAMWKQV